MTDIPLTLACGDYEIVRAIKEGAVSPDGIDLTVLTRLDSSTRHWRFLRNGEFDVAELSASSYLLARDAGMEIEGIPVFLHRRFRHEFVFVNTAAGIRSPKDLIGRKVGVKSFQVSAILWMRGILEHEYGVPHKSIHWHAEIDEDVAFTPPADLKLSRLPNDRTLEDMLLAGELDAVIHSDIIEPYQNGDPRVARLFADYKAEEEAYFRRTGIFPIMHVVGIRRTLVEAHPWLANSVFEAFERAKKIALEHLRDTAAFKVTLPWLSANLSEAEAVMGHDFWPYGVEANLTTLRAMLDFAWRHGTLSRELQLDEIFVPSTRDRFKV
eukprot:gene23451-24905_t